MRLSATAALDGWSPASEQSGVTEPGLQADSSAPPALTCGFTFTRVHDDGRWYEAELLDQHRAGGRWRAVVRYSVAPGMRYVRGMWADELRAAE
jgi:hypothetical protein